MSLLHKSSLTGENFFDSNGNPIPGTPFIIIFSKRLMSLIKKVIRRELNLFLMILRTD